MGQGYENDIRPVASAGRRANEADSNCGRQSSESSLGRDGQSHFRCIVTNHPIRPRPHTAAIFILIQLTVATLVSLTHHHLAASNRSS